jgi:hypothetical protein
MPGLGAVLTFTLIVLLPELGKLSRKQIAVLRLEGMTFPICGKAPSRAPASLTLTPRLK